MIVITVNRYMGFEAAPLIPHVTKCYSSYTGINWVYIKAANLVETWSLGCHSQLSGPSLLIFFFFISWLFVAAFFLLLNWSSLFSSAKGFNCHLKIAVVWESNVFWWSFHQFSGWKSVTQAQMGDLLYTSMHTHRLARTVLWTMDMLFFYS